MHPLFDLAIPSQLLAALIPDLILMGGAMTLLLVAVWRRESREHQRLVGELSIGLCAIVLAAVWIMMNRLGQATDGPIAVDNFRWMADLVILLGTMAALALGIGSRAPASRRQKRMCSSCSRRRA
jgi:NADH:ubiquinone oxidoreductase subunit 2 (subunit N)